MTPKEKAKELFEKYSFVEIAYYTSKHEVKECALIAVDEILNELMYLSQFSANTEIKWKKVWYESVKLEIEKL